MSVRLLVKVARGKRGRWWRDLALGEGVKVVVLILSPKAGLEVVR